jgi:beta-barrel assembly-enhancing protease
MRKRPAFFLLLLAPLVISACQTASLGTLTQHIDSATKVVEATSKAARPISEDEEYYVGRAVAAKILGTYSLSKNQELTRYVNLIGKTIALGSDKPFTYGGYHFAILDTDELNALACPGGIIFITKGMVNATSNEDELAAVLAHEVAHINKRDGISAIKSARWTEAVTVIGTQAAKAYSPGELSKLVGLFEGSIDDIFKTLVVNGYSKSQEYSADEGALLYLAKSGYNPNALPDFLKRLAGKGKTSGGGILQTHPGTKDRIDNISGKIPAANLDIKAVELRTSRFNKVPR